MCVHRSRRAQFPGVSSAADEREGVDLTAVAQHFERYVGTGRAPGRAHECDVLAALDGLADRDQRALVVGVARREAIAMIDLDELPVAGALTRPGHHARRHRGHWRADRAGEIHTLVEGLEPIEGIGALA